MPLMLRSTYLSVITCSIIFLVYAWWVFQVLGVGYFTGPDALVRTGKAISILIVAGFGFEIAVQIGTVFLRTKLRRLTTTDDTDELIVDERDKQILHRSLFVSLHVLCAGLFLAIFALAAGFEAFWVFHIIVLFYALAVATELGIKIFLFKRGI